MLVVLPPLTFSCLLLCVWMQTVPFVLAGLSHVEKQARELVVDQFIAQLGRRPSPDQYKAVVRAEELLS